MGLAIGYNIHVGIKLIGNHCLGLPKAFMRLSPTTKLKEYEIVGNEPDKAVFKLQLVENFVNIYVRLI